MWNVKQNKTNQTELIDTENRLAAAQRDRGRARVRIMSEGDQKVQTSSLK